MYKVQELNERLAAVYKEAEEAGLQINWDGSEGCTPCNTIGDCEESCLGCPYRLRDLGYEVGSPWHDDS